MKLTIERTALLKALGHVQSVVERRNTIPILSNVLLTAGRDTLSFSATDLDMEITDSTNALVDVPGQITAPAHTLYEIVRKLPEGADVALSYSGEDPRLQVQAGRYKVNLPVLPSGDFPVMASDGLSPTITVDTTDLMRLIDKTRFAISTEETRYYLTGIYLHSVVEDGRQLLRAVATDGHRLALEDAGETVGLRISPQKVRFEFGAAALISKVIDGSFPDYTRVIPRDNTRLMSVDNRLFAAAVDRVATISSEKSRSVKLAVEAGKVTLMVRNMETGQATEELEVDYDGEPFDIGFNARYLMDVAGQIGGETAEFRFADRAASATMLDPVLALDPTDAGVQYVLMPLRA